MINAITATEDWSDDEIRLAAEQLLQLAPLADAPPASCPIGWQPAALTPVFYGARDYGTAQGAPGNVRVFFPSLDGAVFSAPILAGCGHYPLILFAHGDCHPSVEHYKAWFTLPAQLARAGYVVAVPELPGISIHPSAENHPALATLANMLTWMRGNWEHRDVLMANPATGIVGHSFGALLSARFAQTNPLVAFASLSGVWEDWPGGSAGPVPFASLNLPMLFIWGDADLFVRVTPQQWDALSRPKHRIIFDQGEHWDYLPAGQCKPNRGPCRFLGPAATDYVTMFLGKYLSPELATQLPGHIPDSLTPPPLVLTPEQEFYAGGYLNGVKALGGKPECAVTVTAVPASPKLDVNATLLNFGSVKVGSSRSLTLRIKNDTGKNVTISLPASSGAFRWPALNGPLNNGGATSVTVTFNPPGSGIRTGALIFTSTAPGSPYTIRFLGKGGIGGFPQPVS